jgi:hypothetical protein
MRLGSSLPLQWATIRLGSSLNRLPIKTYQGQNTLEPLFGHYKVLHTGRLQPKKLSSDQRSSLFIRRRKNVL